MAGIKSLAKDTAIYGASSIIGRFLNWCLVPLYTNAFAASEYGIVNYLYSFVALALIILTYGMETGFFRFANSDKEGDDPMKVYSTSLISLAATSSLFVAIVFLCQGWLAMLLNIPQHPEYVTLLAATVALDAFTAIPFAYLRYCKRPLKFATIKLVNIAVNIALNLFFIVLCPWLDSRYPGCVDAVYSKSVGIGYIFISNLAASLLTLVMLIPQLRGFRYCFDAALIRRMLAYSSPLLVLGVAGIMNQTIDKLLLPVLIPDHNAAFTAIGIYGANYKIAIVMVMFMQAFRFAYEPFIFSQNRDSNKTQSYIDAMKYFIIFSMVIFLGVMFYLPILKYFIAPSYFEGLKVVPVVMLAELFFGIFFNLSLWYELTDRTVWGMYFSIFGLAITVIVNVLLVPLIGYMGCAWGAFASYLCMMVASWYFGRKYYPIAYDYKNAAFYIVVAMLLYGIGNVLPLENTILLLAARTVLLLLFLGIIVKKETIPLPGIRRK